MFTDDQMKVIRLEKILDIEYAIMKNRRTGVHGAWKCKLCDHTVIFGHYCPECLLQMLTLLLPVRPAPVEGYWPQCYRCEYRARAHEEGHGPRMECSSFSTATCGCYMYQPVRPLVEKRQKGDRRPMGAPAMISPRMRATGPAECKRVGVIHKGALIQAQIPVSFREGRRYVKEASV